MDVKRDMSIENQLFGYAPLKEIAGNFLSAIVDASEKSLFPWVYADALSLVELAIRGFDTLSSMPFRFHLCPKSVVDSLTLDMFLDSGNAQSLLVEGMAYGDALSVLEESGLVRVKRVWVEGEFGIIGDVMTMWPEGSEYLYRLEVENDKIAQLSKLDAKTWKKITSVKRIDVYSGKTRLPDGCEVKLVQGNIDVKPVSVICSDTGIVPDSLKSRIEIIKFPLNKTAWNESRVKKLLKEGWKVKIVVSRRKEKALEIAEKIEGIEVLAGEITTGFEVPLEKLMFYSDRELWGTIKLAKKRSGGTFADLTLGDISPGEYVVHEDHGVAVYSGLQKLKRDGTEEEFLVLRYAGKDRLYVPLDQIKRVTKYIGSGGQLPKLTRLGGGEWRRVKKRVKENVRKLAVDLLRLYAVRELTPSKPFSNSDLETSAFESEFPFVETDDQLRAVEDIKEDLKKDKPMDRLIVGDVGFGKTEVAMRAAYMAVKSGGQVAVLAPTTVLVEQHYRVFTDRFNKHGIVVEALSRFLNDKEAKEIVSRIKRGAVDIVVGTHRILSEDVEFKKLGLLIVDEEQKFGVAQKEKLKGKRVDTHVLSLTATPIPRTLNMALSGVRDISILATPPEGRKAIENTVEKFEWSIVKDAIDKEKKRGGQVYFVHNRVKTIYTIGEKLSELIPGVRIGIGHGQMSPQALSKVMREFLSGKYDVLLCTTIIENGLDMERVNTLVVDGAEMFGLAQLYQIRGRIGRGEKQAYAYFLYHGNLGKKVMKGSRARWRDTYRDEADIDIKDNYGVNECTFLPDMARSRLDAISELKELGSGFALAQRDLEIRGAGSFLGREQHGSVNAIGFGLYCRLLEETISALRKSSPARPLKVE